MNSTEYSPVARFGALLTPSFSIANDGKLDGKCFAEGSSGLFFWKILISPWMAMGYNCTITGYPNLGNYYQGTGVKGAIARQEIDFNMFYSIMNEIPEVDYSPISSTYLYLLSAYNYQNLTEHKDLLDTYLSFHWSYNVTIFLSFLVFMFSWSFCAHYACKMRKKLRREIRRARKPSYWIMICAILDQDQFPEISNISFTVISLCTSLFFYLFSDCFMLNMISTDLVVIKEPIVIRSYDDIVNREYLSIPIVKGSDIESVFKNARVGSKFWEVAQKIRNVNSYRDIYSSETTNAILKQQMVLFWYDWYSIYNGNFYRDKASNDMRENVRILMKKDENENSIASGFLISKHAPRNVRRYIDKITNRVLEFGTFEHELRNRVKQTTDQYVSYNIDSPDMPEPEIKFINLHNLLYVYVALILCAFIILKLETFVTYIASSDRKMEKMKVIEIRIQSAPV